MTRDEMLQRISSAEITDWMASERITGPLGPARLDYLTAQLSATFVNAIRAMFGREGSSSLSSFLMKWDNRPAIKAQSPQEHVLALRRLNRQLGGTERRRNGGH